MYTKEGITKAINGLKMEIENHNKLWHDGKRFDVVISSGIIKSGTR